MNKIFSMNLDGGDIEQLSIPDKIADKMYYPHAVEKGIICTDRQKRNLCFYDYNTGVLKKIYPMLKLIAITEEEVYFLKPNSKKYMYVFNIKSGIVSKINDIYPGLEKHIAVHIDVEREIAYYIENGSCDTSANSIIGINKYGEIVDIWEKPHIYKDFLNTHAYDGIAFNGKSLVGVVTNSSASVKNNLNCKYFNEDENDYSFMSTIISFDRAGNAHCIYKGNYNRYSDNYEELVTTASQMLKDDVIITMFGCGGNSGYCSVPLDKDYSENKLWFICK